ncbi:PREDICTED: ovostatin-like [Cyprinodon variegatus]|uniref:ovostatin-like n=1 Tax=Cyprinodon variegatus TaxID=28743 RepID=UPI000742B919|nr:PREDICTED: ovostatin-like [Cyprinodon variegatus]
MANPGIQAGVLLSFLCAMFLIEITVQTNPPCPVSYLVTVPAILKSESKDTFCVSLTDPGSHVLVTVILKSKNKQKEVFKKGTSNAFNKCVKFKVPHVNGEEEHLFEVTVKGNDFYSYDATRVLIKSFHPKTLIQTDKHIYNQGEEVKFRALTLDHDLDPLHVTYNHIWIEDPHHNKIAKWKDEEVDKTILPLSYHLGDGAVAGLYRIKVQSGKKIESQSFRVQKHGSTKFKFEIHVPHEVSVGKETFQVKVCTKYYYGRPAGGDATVKVCRPLRNQDTCSSALVLKDDVSLTSLCKTRQKQTCDKGCATFILKMSNFLKPDTKHLLDVLDVKVTLKDKETCLSHTQWERIRISYVIGKLSFQNVPPVYSRDTDLEGQVRALDVHGNPVPNLKVYLFELKHGAPCIVQTLTTDEHGIAYFALPTEKQIGPIHLFASSLDTLEPDQHVGAYYEVAKVKVDVPGPGSETCGFLKVHPIERKLVCSSMEDFTVQYSLSQQISENIKIIYLVLSRGEIVHEGEEELTYSSGVIQGTFTITFRVKPQYAPKIHIVVYTILDCVRVLAHSESFDTEHCFENSVHPKFHPSPVTHDQNVEFCVKANQHSVCGVKIIDALTKRDGKTLSKEQIFAILPEIKGSPVPPELQDHSDCVEVLPRSYYAVSTNQDGADAQTVFNVWRKNHRFLFIRLVYDIS